MRRLPVYLLIDVSGSMSGEPIESVKNGLQMLVSALRKDPQALETAYLSIITFSDSAQQIVPLTELAMFQPPEISAGGCTALGEALDLLCDCAAREVVKSTPEVKGDWRPMMFLMTDGLPTDNPKAAIAKFRAMRWGAAVSCAAGGGDVNLLEKITPECVVALDTADSASIAAFFKWVSSSVSVSSKSVNETKKDVEGLDCLPPPPPEVKVV